MPTFLIVKDGASKWYYDFSYRGKRYRGIGGATRTQALQIQRQVRERVKRNFVNNSDIKGGNGLRREAND